MTSQNHHAAVNVFTMPAPQATTAEAARIAAATFGLRSQVRLLTSERDQNFLVKVKDGRKFVLKISNAAEAPAIGNLQTAALQHIEARAPSFPVPRICTTMDGHCEPILTLEDGSRHMVRLLSFLPGEPVHKTVSSPAQVAALGRCLAELGLALQDFTHPAASHDLLWDLKDALKLRVLLPHVADIACRGLAAAALDGYERHAQPKLRGLRNQVIQNDFQSYNVLVDPTAPDRVTGVLDFGDMVETLLIYDVAVAASYHFEGEAPMARVAAFVAAYHAVSPLLPEEVDRLFDLITMRHVMTITITAWRISLHPKNQHYIMRNHPRAAAALAALTAIGREAATAAFRQACHLE